MDWSDSWRGAFRIELRAEAIGLAWRGWPVLPGTYPTGSRWAGREGAHQDGPVPVHDDWQQRVGADAESVAAWWSGGVPYSLLVATGHLLDAVEVGVELGRRAARALRGIGVPVPIAATPSGRWLFLAESGRRLRPELAECADVRLHSTGSWIPLPPTPFEHGVVHWRVNPEVCGWRLPASDVVQDALVSALRGDVLPELATAQPLVSAHRSPVA
ncbi:bifunctional DNA primase/polymerase [Gandjariella thermophila]|uniref:DNA primase n=1 Tax=Gandjariella thermophila TaxID=1931992 RepID=A0A4D4J294_9PSEU|nr:bifunctional DNA primase/polymerase [Gandjariella thermophila]GDY30745.1 DNA primase [Gandjariella thermophila]